MKKQHTPRWMNQNLWFIITADYDLSKQARIYDTEQRATIQDLINKGYVPIETVSGKAPCTKKHWNLLPYEGKHGTGYRMVSSYKYSGLNSITYFIKPQAV